MQSNKQINILFYQNSSNNQNLQNHFGLNPRNMNFKIYKKQHKSKAQLLQEIKENEQEQRFVTLKSLNIFLADRKTISMNKFLSNKNRLDKKAS